MKGDIRIESEEGKGAAFIFRIKLDIVEEGQTLSTLGILQPKAPLPVCLTIHFVTDWQYLASCIARFLAPFNISVLTLSVQAFNDQGENLATTFAIVDLWNEGRETIASVHTLLRRQQKVMVLVSRERRNVLQQFSFPDNPLLSMIVDPVKYTKLTEEVLKNLGVWKHDDSVTQAPSIEDIIEKNPFEQMLVMVVEGKERLI